MNWINAIAMISGVIGAVTGILGYRKANSIKLLDLRLELKREANQVNFVFNGLDELIEKANMSRERSLAAQQRLSSGDKKLWDQELIDNKDKLERVKPRIKSAYEFDPSMSVDELEKELTILNKINIELASIRKHYEECLIEDKETSKQLMEDTKRIFLKEKN